MSVHNRRFKPSPLSRRRVLRRRLAGIYSARIRTWQLDADEPIEEVKARMPARSWATLVWLTGMGARLLLAGEPNPSAADQKLLEAIDARQVWLLRRLRRQEPEP